MTNCQAEVDYFDRLAAEWDARYRRSRLFRQRYRAVRQIITSLGRSCGTALDYGCGTGVLTGLLAMRFSEVLATDTSSEMLARARHRFAGNSGIHVVEVDEAVRRTYDFVLCSSVVEYVHDPASFIEQVAVLLKPEGVLLMTFAHRYGLLQCANRLVLSRFRPGLYVEYQRHTFSKRQAARLLAKAGLHTVYLATPVGLPLFRSAGLGELIFAVARTSGSFPCSSSSNR